MAAFGTKNLAALDLDDIFGAEVNRPPAYHKFRLLWSKLAADLSFHLGMEPVTVDMADAAHEIVVGPDAQAAQTVATSNVFLVDANSSGTEDLTLNETELPPGLYWIKNTGGESIVVKDSGGSTIGTVATAKTGLFHINADQDTLDVLGVALA